MIVLIDNYDSFTFNLVHYLGGLGAEVAVHRNDKITVGQLVGMDADAIVLSPGPCTPKEAGICLALVADLGPTVPILGVCLGHQAVGQAFGGPLVAGLTMSPSDLTVAAETEVLIMGLARRRLPVHGVQFHPESIASEHGHLILKNFLDIAAAWNAATGRRAARRAQGRHRATR